ncbi:Coq4 family protein [Chroococcus sp. FPU101]|uniref:Coq4 family protein n=1 Tax=Chroococcus sp. FPU101 TaxID=1974212 RepID=UPI001A8E3B7A|nr:Coq4 family protein [Chroococcus sp. FPU101]GFE67961.1 unknown protein [Chroococcus sp. FPU101]
MNNQTLRNQTDEILEQFIALVQAPYGDFQAIGLLVNATSDPESMQKMLDRLFQTPWTQLAFRERFQLGKIDLHQLSLLPPDTFGYAYGVHLLSNGLKPVELKFTKSENDYSYLMTHLTETHDIWHVAIGADTSMEGEIKLQAFIAAQLHFSRFALAMLAKNFLKTAIHDIDQADQRLDALTQGWIMGKQAKCLVGIKWNTLWEMPLEQLRTELYIIPQMGYFANVNRVI